MNELLLVGEAALTTAVVLLTWSYARSRLYGLISIFLILIASVGGKIVTFFGHETNTGNIFYASIFLATYFLIERLGRREGVRSVWIGVIAVGVFFTCVQLTVALDGAPATAQFNQALAAAYAPFSRVTAASLIAYIVSQNLNVYLYTHFRDRWNGARLWLRANIANFIAQLVDSCIFFTVAFYRVVPPSNIYDILVTGFVIKVAFMAVTAPLLRLNRVEAEDGPDYSMISVR